MKKTWKQKLTIDRQPEVCPLDKPFQGFPAGATMLIPTPLLVKEYIEAIPLGQSRTIPEMRADLARRFEAQTTCPLTSGIFVRIVAEAALEELAAGTPEEKITPFWRMIDRRAPALKKLSCPPDFVLAHRRAEGLSE